MIEKQFVVSWENNHGPDIIDATVLQVAIEAFLKIQVKVTDAYMPGVEQTLAPEQEAAVTVTRPPKVEATESLYCSTCGRAVPISEIQVGNPPTRQFHKLCGNVLQPLPAGLAPASTVEVTEAPVTAQPFDPIKYAERIIELCDQPTGALMQAAGLEGAASRKELIIEVLKKEGWF